MKKRVAFLLPALSDGGAQLQCLRLLQTLQDHPGVDLMLIYLHEGVHSGHLATARYRVEKIATQSNFDIRNIPKIRKILNEFGADILFTWLHACDVYGYALKKLDRQRPWLMAERSSAYPAGFRYKLREKLGRHADAIVCNSAAGRRYWEKLGASAPLHVVPNIVSRSHSTGRSGSDQAVLFVGRLEPQKNVLVLAEAFCRLAVEQPELQFRIVGEGSCRAAIEAIIEAAQVGDRVKLLGFRLDARDLIEDARLLVTLSHFEGMPNVLVEAAAAHTLAVVSDIPEHREVLGAEYPFVVADRSSVPECLEAMRNALKAPSASEHYVFADQVLARMSAETVAEQYYAIFDQLTTVGG